MNADPEQARRLFFEGVARFESGRLDEARQAFEAALAHAPGRPSVLLNLGVTLLRLGRPRDALAPLGQAASADAGQPDAWAHLGLAHESLGRWSEAAAAFERAVALAPSLSNLWLALGRCRLREGAAGAADAALRAFERACEADPRSADAWSARGGLLREAGRPGDAAECFENALALGADADLHRYYLASVRGDAVPARPPRAYVETLFDEYADEFQAHLVDGLRYRAHETLAGPLLAPGRRYARVIDLGCGSGLCGRLLRPNADTIVGVDVSSAMIALARETGVYDELAHADLAEFLARPAPPADLVLAADVFIYVGELGDAFAAVRRALAPGGVFAFSVERAASGRDLELLPSLRYAHSHAYLERLAGAHGFRVRETFEAPLRDDQSRPVQGLYAYLE